MLPMTPEERKKTEIAEKKGKSTRFPFPAECGWETVIPEEKSIRLISIATIKLFKKEDYIT